MRRCKAWHIESAKLELAIDVTIKGMVKILNKIGELAFRRTLLACAIDYLIGKAPQMSL